MKKCAACQSENPSAARFCCQCGTALDVSCANCGSEILPGARFCHLCATPLPTVPGAAAAGPIPAGAVPARPLPASTPGPVTSERRHLTVMFCDLAGSTALAGELDPEDLQTAVREFQTVSNTMVKRFDGHVAQYLGDGILVYFGYPQAHEDDAHRAVRTALALLESLEGMNARLKQHRIPPLQVRVGIHTGIVVIGDHGGTNRPFEQLALGETPNLAARVQALAAPDTVVISRATHRLIEGYFECQPLGERPLKGISQPVSLFLVLRESTAMSRLDVVGQAAWTPLVGREHEIALLQNRWEQAKEGYGEVVLLSGEGGIGKSRLVHTLIRQVAEDPQTWLTQLQCSPYHQHSTLYPMVDFLNRIVFKFEKNTPVEDKRLKIEGLLLQYGLPLAETVPLFASLLGLPAGKEYPPLNLTPERQIQNTLHTIEAILIERASRQPLLFLVEDLQWIDPTTLELLTMLVNQVPARRILALYTCRPEFKIPWQGRSHVTQITLNRLGEKQIADMVTRLTQGKTLPVELVEQIYAKTDGVPLFVEELTKMVLESGYLCESASGYRLDRALPALAIPATLQDSLMARLDRLSKTKDLAQLCSVLGREFSYELLEAVAEMNETVLQQELTALNAAELLYQRGLPPEATFYFKHALIQDAAYQSLVRSKRQQYHQRIGLILKKRFPEIAAAQPGLIARHFTEACLYREAVEEWGRAGEHAVQRSAHAEAIAHLTHGLELLTELPEVPMRHQLEIKLRICLGPSLTAIKGYGAKEVELTYARAMELCEQWGDPAQHFQVLYGLWRWNLLRANHETARTKGEKLLQLAADAPGTAFSVGAHRALGATLFYLGDLAGSRRHLEWVLSATAAPREGSSALIQDIYDVVDPRVTCRSYSAWNLWLLGYPDQAREECNAALALARALNHPFSMALALSFATWLHQFLGDIAKTRALARAAITLADEQGFPFWIGWGKVLRGWADSHQGDGVAAIAEIRQGIAEWRAQGSELGLAYFLTLLADSLARQGQVAGAREALAEAQGFAERTHEHYWLAERHRLEGELMMADGAAGEDRAAALFAQARTLAAGQQARSLVLRATHSLARLRVRQNRPAEVRPLLEPVLAEFTEGQSTRDVAEARALLAANP